MKNYTNEEMDKLLNKYREKGIGSTGKSSGKRLYRRGIKLAKKSDRYDMEFCQCYYLFGECDEWCEKRG